MPLNPSSRLGFTLVELLIALTLALLVGSTAVTILNLQQRFARDAHTVLNSRLHLRDATSILAAELHSASVTDSIRFAADTAVELFTTIGSSIVCATPTATSLVLPPDTLASDSRLTALLITPDVDDELSIFNDSTATIPTRGWSRHAITNTARQATASACPPTSSFTTAADVAANRRAYVISLGAPPAIAPVIGTPLRFIRRGRYNIYRASDGQWYLGYRRCPLGVCTAVQPIAGPYAAQNGTGVRPLEFHYFTADGIQMTSTVPTIKIARIDVIARIASSTIRFFGTSDTLFTDSSVTTIALRNAP